MNGDKEKLPRSPQKSPERNLQSINQLKRPKPQLPLNKLPFKRPLPQLRPKLNKLLLPNNLKRNENFRNNEFFK